MSPGIARPPLGVIDEVSVLIEALHQAGQRLEHLTGGEVDTVADRHGQTFLLRSAQDQVRQIEADKQAAILNALPASIALLDTQGVIVSVNEAWRQFTGGAVPQSPGSAIGLNYLDVCDAARGAASPEAQEIANGIRSVLNGAVTTFSVEYRCHSPTAQRWYLLTVTPLALDRPNGAVIMHLDITERKRGEEEIRRFAAAMDALADAVVLVDRSSMRIVHANDAACRYMNKTREQLLALDPWVWLATSRADLERGYDALIASGVPAAPIEILRRRKDGSEPWIELRRHAARSEDRWVIVTIMRDVTERKQSQQALLESERRLSDMLANVELVAVMLDREARITYCNEHFLRLTGWGHEEVIGQSWVEKFIPSESGDLQERLATLLTDRPEARHGESVILTRSGERLLIRWNNSLLRSGTGEVTGTASIGEDITEQRRGEEALRRFRAAMNATPDAIYLTDRTSMRFVHVNDAACRMQGLTREELLALGPAEMLSTSRAELERTYDAMIASGMDAEPLELARTRKDGLQARLEVRRHAHRSGDRWTIVTLVRDVTERKQAEVKIVRLNRVYAVLSGINTAIVRIRERDELFREVCRIAVSEGGFSVARVLELDANAKVRIAATSESDSRIFQGVVDAYNRDPEHSQSLLAVAMRERQPVISNDVAADTRIPHRAALTKDGNYALAMLPIIVDQRIAGSVMLRTREAGTFDDAELHLLLELVSNLSFALEHMEKARKLDRLTRVNAMLSGINTAIVRIRDRQALFEEACRIAVETGGFTLAWIGVVEGEANVLIPVAWVGPGREYIDKLRLEVGDSGPGADTLGAQAIRERRPAVSNDVAHDPRVLLVKEMVEHGMGSMVVLPLVVHGKSLGTLTLVAAESGFFDEDEMKLLGEVAANIAFALEHIEKEEKVERLTRVYAVLSGINTLIVRVKDRDELFREACRVAVEDGHFLKAWIGIVGSGSQPFRIVAAHGADPRFFESIVDQLSTRLPAGKGLVARALATGKPVVMNNAASDPEMLLKDSTIQIDVRSIAVLPLIVANEAIGVLTLSADTVGFFDDEEMKLLAELAGDIAFAINHLGKRDRLDYLAYYDPLTGLANRRLFLERTGQYMRSASAGGHKLAVFLVDLERFRNINDSLGRPAGDALLKQVAEWMTRKGGDSNLLARVSADQFAVVLPEVKQEGSVARLIQNWMDASLAHPFRLNDAVFRIAAKVGVAVFPEDGDDADLLFRNAEAALKKAKTTGQRYLFYTQTMTDAVTGKLTMENQLRQALDNQEFVLHYQPKVNLQSGKLVGVEALIRWNDPLTGLVPPGRFIPILEETGMIQDVGRWALRKAIEDYLRWRAAGLPVVRIAVNVSPLQLHSRGFIAEIEEAIGVDPLAAAGLELEITESVIMEDVKHNIASLQAIRAMGVTIAIDDFGTGFSSLSYLARLPVDTLKIDRSFVIDMAEGPQGLALVSTIISLAHALKLKVVAEGVETEEQARLLRLLSCDEMQGFLFSKPVPAEIFETRFLSLLAAA